MDIIGARKFVEIPGGKQHELPPPHPPFSPFPQTRQTDEHGRRHRRKRGHAGAFPFPEELSVLDQRKMELAIHLVENYQGLVLHWRWGEDILEWIRQCEITFESRQDLRHLLHGDVWPHAGRSSFVQLLEDKDVPTDGIDMEKAVGLRLTFRHPPPLSCFSNQFLFYLKDSVGNSAYQAWASKNPAPVSSLPPERFTLQVLEM